MAAYTLRAINDKLWRAVKVLAAQRGISIKALILGLDRDTSLSSQN